MSITTQILTTTFNLRIFPRQIPQFRGAVVDKVMALKEIFEREGISTDLFHNHENEANAELPLLFRYPLIQYQWHSQHATITGINEGARALALLLQNNDGQIQMHQKTLPFGLTGFPQIQMVSLQQTEQFHEYRLYKWLALNQENFKIWEGLETFRERLDLLERILESQLIMVLQKLGKPVAERWELQTQITDFGKSDWTECHNTRLRAFDLTFRCKATLPPNIGLGKAVAFGFGKQIPHLKRKNTPNKVQTIEEQVMND